MVSSFSWTGSSHGVWSDPSNWTDVTSSPTPATTAPGASDVVDLPGNPVTLRVVNGPGHAASLTLSQQLELGGTFDVGTLLQSGTLALITGSLIAGSATLGGWVDNIGAGMAAGSLAINGGTLTIEAGAWMEVGTDGTADGSYGLVVDAGRTLTGSAASLSVGSVLNRGTISGSFSGTSILGGTNTGMISGLSLDTIVNDGTVMTGVGQHITVGNLSGSGELDVSQGGTLEITQGVASAVTFVGPNATLDVDAAGLAGDVLSVRGFGGGDTIRIGGGVTSASFTPNGIGDGTLTATTGAGVFTIDVRGSYTVPPAAILQDGTVSIALSLPCFATGTRILTRRGEVPVEGLCPGDEVATLLPEGFRPVRWVGHRVVRLAGHPHPRDIQPVCVRANAFAPGMPRRDLYLSPDHALFADGVLIPVKYLVNGESIAQVEVRSVTYWHVELDLHDVLLAEGLPAESYLDTGDRGCFDNGDGAVTLHPRFGALAWEAEGCAPMAVTGPVLEQLRARLRARASRTSSGPRAA
jgi:collagen type I/II/III/V/XI/XXIV/XXVII alpha